LGSLFSLRGVLCQVLQADDVSSGFLGGSPPSHVLSMVLRGLLAEDGLEVHVRSGDGHDVEGVHQGLQDVGGDEGGEAGA
jgi:hypothetical protein